MSINLNNYEIYFIDYFDGNLSVEDERLLMIFLNENPELKEELDGFENLTIKSDNVVFSKKAELKKTEIYEFKGITEENYVNKFIAFHEGDLNIIEKNKLEKFIEKNPSLQSEFELCKNLKIIPEEIKFPNKNSLIRKTRIFAWQYQTMAAAASIVLLIGLFLFYNNDKNVENRIAININPIEKQNITIPTINENVIKKREIAIVQVLTEETIKETKLNVKTENNHLASVDYEKLRSEKINILSDNKKALAVVGEIDCARLLHRKVNTTILASNDVMESKSLFSKVVANNSNKLARSINTQRVNYAKTNGKDPFFVKFMQGTVNVFNTITGSNVEQLKVYDDKGNLRNYKIDTPILTMNKNYPPHGVE